MKQKVILSVSLVILVIIGALAFGYFSAKNAANEQNSQQRQTSNATSGDVAESPAPIGQPGAYVGYTEDIVEKTKGTKILFFHAPWCPQCRSLENSIETTDIPDGVTIIKVDYDTNQKLRERYGVTLQTTLVKVDDNGELIEKYVAYNDPTYASIKTHLID
jgi:thiol-disulfide isomerase/thioredoxin